MIAAAALLLLPLGPAAIDDVVADAVSAARAHPASRVVAVSADLGSHCRATSARALEAVARSGPVAVQIDGTDRRGRPCSARGFVRVRVRAPVVVATRDAAVGEPLDGATKVETREIVSAAPPLNAVPVDAIAARTVRAGELLTADAVRRPGLALGAPVRVVVVAGSLRVSAHGVVVPCPTGDRLGCARLPTGQRVSGRLEGDTLVVEAP